MASSGLSPNSRQMRHQSEAAELWAAYDERWSALSSYAEQLGERARSKSSKDDGDFGFSRCYDVVDNSLDPPDNIDDLYDALKEDPATAKRIMASISPQSAGWLAQHIQNKTFQEREEAEREIERELDVRTLSRTFLGSRALRFSLFVLRETSGTSAS